MPALLVPGAILPNVELPATDGSKVSLATLCGRSIVAVYPWTGRPGLPNPPDWDIIPGAHGSTRELEGFRDLFDEFARRGVGIFGLSSQTTAYQREMATRLRLPFPSERCARALRCRARFAHVRDWRRDLSEAPHTHRRRWPHRTRILFDHRARASCRRGARLARSVAESFVLGVFHRITEAIEPFFEIVGEHGHAEEIVFGAISALGARRG